MLPHLSMADRSVGGAFARVANGYVRISALTLATLFASTQAFAQVDSDADGVIDDNDLCPLGYDPNNLDTDMDGIGDACDTDDVDYVISTVAGIGSTGFCGDGGEAIYGRLHFPEALTFDNQGSLLIADTFNHRIRKIDSSGNIVTIAGSGNTAGFSGDGGTAISATLNRPRGIAVDPGGSIYVADTGNKRVRRIDTSGNITTVAGNGGDFSGDGGSAVLAGFDGVNDVITDMSGNIFVADAKVFSSTGAEDGLHQIRRVSGSGNITSLLSGSDSSFHPVSFTYRPDGNLLVSDWETPGGVTGEHRIWLESGGVLTPLVGDGTPGFSGDGGDALFAQIDSPRGMAYDAIGNLYIADAGNGANSQDRHRWCNYNNRRRWGVN